MNKITDKFKALVDQTRVRILYLLINSDSELCVCELTDALEIPQYNISRHLKILRNAGLIEERKEGRWVYFGLIKGADTFTKTIFDSVNHISEIQLSKDLTERDKRLAMRADGKCHKGIQKSHLIGSRLQR